MVPWCGRVENGQFRDGGVKYQLPLNSPPHAIHGTARDHAWKTARVSDDRGRVHLRAGRALAVHRQGHPDLRADPGRADRADGRRDVRQLLPGAGRLAPLVRAGDRRQPASSSPSTPEWQEERGDDHLPTGRRIPPAAGPLGRLLRDARRRRRHPHLARAARTEGDQPHRVGRRLRRAGRGRVRGAAVRARPTASTRCPARSPRSTRWSCRRRGPGAGCDQGP